jgi:hypothetical protein
MAYDNFIDNNGVLLPAHNALWADAAQYGGLAGNFVIEGGQLLAPAGFAAARYTGSSRDESQITLPNPLPAALYGPAIRMGASGIGYYVLAEPAKSGGFIKFYLLSCLSGSVDARTEVIAEGAAPILGLSMAGSTVSVYFNGTLILSYTDPSPLPAGNPGIVGIPATGSSGGIIEWNDGVLGGYFPWFRRRIMTAGMATLGG